LQYNEKLLKYIESLEIAAYNQGFAASQYPDKKVEKDMLRAKNKVSKLNAKIKEFVMKGK